MEQKDKKEKKKLNIKEIGLEKLIIMFLAGIFIIVLSFPDFFPKKKESNTTSPKTQSITSGSNTSKESEDDNTDQYISTLEEKLKSALKKVEGIGDAEVMITLKASKELVTLKDTPYTQDTTNETDQNGGSRISSNITRSDESVLVTSEDGDSIPYVIKEIEPEIEGVVVIAEGGGNQTIVGEIIDAVEVLFDVPTHKIKVMKMNSR